MNATLGLMFSNVSGSTKVDTRAANVQEYVLNMPDAANAAFADLASVCPYVSEKVYHLPLEDNTISLESEFPNFCHLLENECVEVTNGIPIRFDGYYLHGNHKLTFTQKSGTVSLVAAVLPILVSDSTLDNTEIHYPHKALVAVSYYMAHRLYLEDDNTVSAYYMNIYQSMKEELAKEFDRSAQSFRAYTNKAGWL